MSSAPWMGCHHRFHTSSFAYLSTSNEPSQRREACRFSDFAGAFGARSSWSYYYSSFGMESDSQNASESIAASVVHGLDLYLISLRSSGYGTFGLAT